MQVFFNARENLIFLKKLGLWGNRVCIDIAFCQLKIKY